VGKLPLVGWGDFKQLFKRWPLCCVCMGNYLFLCIVVCFDFWLVELIGSSLLFWLVTIPYP